MKPSYKTVTLSIRITKEMHEDLKKLKVNFSKCIRLFIQNLINEEDKLRGKK